ncbi:MAG TPA: hypothetical protein VG298_16210 [Acidimicrobiales bacterium]|nr:hypothetical protein [Acidimicrobiales bacterium]
MAAVLSTGFVVLRWLDAAHRQLGQFVVAGSRYVKPNRVTKGLPIHGGSGYDGQFYYRLALSPFNLARTAYGIRLDSFSRVERVGYPFLVWVVARGHDATVPLAMVIVNVVACGVLALAGGLLAQSAGRHALWGLVFAGYWGYLWTLGRDLTELTSAALLMLALAALLRHAPIWSGLAFLGAVVSKETSVLLIGTLTLVTIYLRLKARPSLLSAGPAYLALSTSGAASGSVAMQPSTAPSTAPSTTLGRLRPRRSDLALIIPLAGFILWQVVLLSATGKLPIYKSGGENLSLPFVGLYHGVVHYVTTFPSISSALWIGELLVLALLAVAAVLSLRSSPLEFRFLWMVSVLLALCAATGIFLGDVGFRSLDDAFLMGWVILLFRPQRMWPMAVICGGVWLVVSAELIRFI